jgi:sugar phosphate isomerase/epimerase
MSKRNRRKFLKASASILGGAILSSRVRPGFPAVISDLNRPNSKFNGVQIGTITYSYRSMPDQSAEAMLGYLLDSGINAVELMGDPAENFAGRPESRLPRGFRPGAPPPPDMTTAQRQERDEILAELASYNRELAIWRASVPMTKFEQLRRMYEDAGVSIYAWKPSVFEVDSTDAEINYGFRVAKALGASHCTVELPQSSAQSLRLGRLAERNGVYIAYHTHEQASIDIFNSAFSQSDFNRSNVDLGHYVAAPEGRDPLAFIAAHHDKISSAHLKDRQLQENGAGNLSWGTGDTPLVQILQTVRDQRYTFPITAELEYQIPEGSNAVLEVAKCVEFCRNVLEA